MLNIIIFSTPIHSGKTTSLMNWCNVNNKAKGILMPELNDKKCFYDIEQKEYFDAVCFDEFVLEDELQIIGKYQFSTAAFNKANHIIKNSKLAQTDWLIIDEVGKLELLEKGFHPSLKFLLTSSTKINLLIVVRDTLIKEVTNFYQISHYTIISNLDELIIH